MKKILIIICCIASCSLTFAGDKYRMSILKEISSQEASNYPKKWQLSKFTCDYYGDVERRYFIPVSVNFDEGSSIEIIKKNTTCTPHWKISIDGYTYYASFDDEDDLNVGDSGKLKYDGSTKYFEKY